jgi:hypothetical protein
MTDLTEHLARALIEAHGDAAVDFAEQALINVRNRGLSDRILEWERVIAAIKAIQGGGP